MTSKLVTLAFAALVVTQTTHACSIVGLRQDFPFTPGSPVLEASHARTITDWYISLRDSSLGIAEVRIRAYFPKGNSVANDVARTRVAAVKQLVRVLGASDPVPLTIVVEGINSIRPASYDEVHIGVQPKCGSACCG